MDREVEKVRIIRIGEERSLTEGVNAAVNTIFRGGIVAFPTESFYGLAVAIDRDDSLRHLFRMKGREQANPILILIPDAASLEKYVEKIPEGAGRLVRHFWPGGLTLVLRARPGISPLLTAGTGKIGVRFSSHPVAAALPEALGKAVTGTSANRSGASACSAAEEVLDVFGDEIDLVLDGGRTRGDRGSTVLDVTVDPPLLLREGMISRERIETCLAKAY